MRGSPTVSKTMRAAVIRVQDLSQADIQQMFMLMQLYYDNIKYEIFFKDLQEKHWVIVVRNKEEKIAGFSTLLLIDMDHIRNPLPVKLLFSGDTVLHRDYWGNMYIPLAWGRFCTLTLPTLYPEHMIFWILISKGYKTYRYMPSLTRMFFPRYDIPTPAFEQSLMHAFGELKYPGRYDPALGIIHNDGSTDLVKKGVAELKEKHLKDPHLRYFADKNPGYLKGDELVCIMKCTFDNLAEDFQKILTGSAGEAASL